MPDSGCRIPDSGFQMPDSGFQIQIPDSVLTDDGPRCPVSGIRYLVSGGLWPPTPVGYRLGR